MLYITFLLNCSLLFYSILEFAWQDAIPLPKLRNQMMISLPGYLYTSYTHIKYLQNFEQVDLSKFSILIQWKINYYKKIEHLITTGSIPCKNIGSMKCLNTYNVKSKVNYILLRHTRRQLVSWNQAQKVCEDAGMLLPYFTSREQYEEIIALLKVSKDILPFEGLFIGLKCHGNAQVTIYIFTYMTHS